VGQGEWHVLDVIRRLGCIQIDTINVVERSHYLALWSRLGQYDKGYLDQLLCPDRKVFEYWAHAASIIPIEHYRYFMRVMRESRRNLKTRAQKRLGGKAKLLDKVLHEVKRRGPVSSKDFEEEGERKGKRVGWWDWKPAKIALEMLFNAGILMVAYRKNFQRYYDMTENVLPSDIDTTEPTEEERRRFFLKRAIDALGVANQVDMAGYYYEWSTRASLRGKGLEVAVKELLHDDVLGEVTVEGDPEPNYMLTKDFDIAEKVARGDMECFNNITFLSPFDNLLWSRMRLKTLFNFATKLEAYLPRDKREFGYYAMNVLYRNRIIGRFDPKLHRDSEVLEIKSLRFEDHFRSDSVFEEELSQAFRSFMEFNNAKHITFGKIVPRSLRIDTSYC